MRKRYPSQIRYEEKNPAITFRLLKQEKEKIQQLSQISQKSISQLVRIGLLTVAKDFSKAYEEAYQRGKNDGINLGYKQGYNEGYNIGKKDWAIWAVCWRCKKNMLIVPNSEEHKKILYRMEGDLYHGQCAND